MEQQGGSVRPDASVRGVSRAQLCTPGHTAQEPAPSWVGSTLGGAVLQRDLHVFGGLGTSLLALPPPAGSCDLSRTFGSNSGPESRQYTVSCVKEGTHPSQHKWFQFTFKMCPTVPGSRKTGGDWAGYDTWAGSGGRGKEGGPGIWTSSSRCPRTHFTAEETAVALTCTKSEGPHP